MSHSSTQQTSFHPNRCLRLVLAVFALLVASSGSLRADVIYDSLPGIPPGNNGQPGGVVSLSYSANQTTQWGDNIGFAAGNWLVSSATVTMANYAQFSDFMNDPRYSANSTSWSHPVTLTLYNVDHSGANPALGSEIASSTVNATIPWHGNNGFEGTAFNVTFPFNNVPVPSEIIYGISFNTELNGPNPIGSNGPYNFLNVGFGIGPSVGTNIEPDAVFWNTNGDFYSTPGPLGVFRRDTGWDGDTPAIQFIGQQAPPVGPVPEPASLAVFAALGVTALGLRRRKVGV